MKEIVTSTIVKCDVCKRTNPSCTEHRIDNSSVDLCANCEKILKNMLAGEDFEIALNMNQSIRVRLGKDSADSYNRYWAGIKTVPVKAGEWKKMQFWCFLQECADAFRKSFGCMQNIATPFEIRMKFRDIHVVENPINE
ncbi:MAG: hypothetical protein PHX61_12560 [Alphaproteobacteria bacterium]|nr:hypothetical protein [Alphaproteobacteria bacterium]